MSCQPQGSSSKLQVKGLLEVEALWKPENGPGVRPILYTLYYSLYLILYTIFYTILYASILLPPATSPCPAYHTEPRLSSLHSHTQSCKQLRRGFCSGWEPRFCLGTVQLAE